MWVAQKTADDAADLEMDSDAQSERLTLIHSFEDKPLYSV